jgi:hypothetical protein
MLLTLQFQIEQYINESTLILTLLLLPLLASVKKTQKTKQSKRQTKVIKSKGSDNQTHSMNGIDYPTDKIA